MITVSSEAHHMTDSRVSLSGSKITHILFQVSLFIGVLPILVLIEGIWMDEDLAVVLMDIGPYVLSTLLVCYLSYSYRMVVERESGSGTVLFSRQILHSNIRFGKRAFDIDQLEVKQITKGGGGGEGSNPTDYTTVIVDGKDFFTYIGHRRKILKAIPELNKKLQRPDVSLTMRREGKGEEGHRKPHSKDVWVGPDGTESGPGVPEDWYLTYDGPAPKVEAVHEDNYGVDRGNGAIPVDFYVNKWGIPEGFGPTNQEEIWWDQ